MRSMRGKVLAFDLLKTSAKSWYFPKIADSDFLETEADFPETSVSDKIRND